MTVDRWPILLAAPVLGVGIATLAWLARRRRIRAATAWSLALGAEARRLGRWSPVVLGLAALAAGIGLAGPRWGTIEGATASRALNIALVMDVSRSMLAQDVAPSRLDRSISLARRLVQDLSGDRLGLVAFAANGYLLSPLTLDQSALEVQLDALDPDMASEGGSGVGAALDVARRVLSAATEGGDRAIVLFTDGESFEGADALKAAGAGLSRDRIRLIAIPIGSVKGARIPEPGGGYHRDQSGQEVITSRRDDLLKLVTDAAEGVLVPADSPDPVGAVRRALNGLSRTSVTGHVATNLVPRAWIFALIAALLLLGHAVTRRSAALACLLLSLGAGTAHAQRPSPGTRALTQGAMSRARAAFAAEAKQSGRDTSWYNAGTSALVAGDLPAAIDALQRASISLDPELRRRALYNLGTARLQQARRDSARRDGLLRAAATDLQGALLLDPSDRNAKFNYELARRQLPPPQQQSASRNAGGEAPKPPPSDNRNKGMTQAEAEQVLNALERAERDTRLSQYAKNRMSRSSRGPDW